MVAVLKQRISEPTHENNRYHLAISYCTVCAPDVADSEVSSASSVSINIVICNRTFYFDFYFHDYDFGRLVNLWKSTEGLATAV